jgi:hypothetical protein
MKTSKIIRFAVILFFPFLATLYFGCPSKNSPTSPPAPTATPLYSSTGVTVVSGSGEFFGITYYKGDLWFINLITNTGPYNLDEYTAAGVSVLGIATFNGSKTFNNPWGVKAGPDGTIYVADWMNNQVEVFSSSGTYQTNITGLTSVWDVAVNSASTTLYALLEAPSIQTYSITGTTSKTFTSTGSFSTTGSGAGTLDNARFLALDAGNNVYTANNTPDVVKYAPDGSNPVSFGSPSLSKPYGLVVDSAGNVLVADYNNGFIQEFKPAGSTFTAGVTFGNSQLNQPCGLTLDGSGNLYAATDSGVNIVEFKKTN